jgi:hypothetical protein
MDSPRFPVIEILPKGKPFHATHSLEHILQPILELCQESVGRRMVILVDNARSHTAPSLKEFVSKLF